MSKVCINKIMELVLHGLSNATRKTRIYTTFKRLLTLYKLKRLSISCLLLTITQQAFTCSKLTIKTLKQGVKRRRSGVFIVNFEHISHLVLVFLLLILNKYLPTW